MTSRTNTRWPAGRSLIGAVLIAAPLLLATDPVGAAENMPSRERTDKAMVPVELTMDVENGAARCEPADLRLPADSDVALRIVNRSKHQFTLTAPRIFENKNVLHHDGDLAHVASDDGYTVKANGKGDLRVRTIAAGQYPFACTSVQNQSEPFRGTLTLAPANQ